ncbi:hypothetical protein [uncultured Mediterranean phage uvMED]|nr:hypothetical protein [uncultured Mediterranean phage uvMED]
MINSFSVCANDRAKREVALLIKSVRQFHDCPIYVFCDIGSKTFLESLGFTDVHYKLELEPERLAQRERLVRHITNQNGFHCKSIILSKMDCIEWALSETGNTFFVDADIVFLNPVDQEIDESIELMLSPHFHVEDKVNQNRTYGAFNAGYLWTNSDKFPESWREIYTTRSEFYEQAGMKHLWEEFDIKTFGKDHNLGFWRFAKQWNRGRLLLIEPAIDWDQMKSVHFHAFPETYSHADKGLVKGYDQLKELITPHLPEELRRFADAI